MCPGANYVRAAQCSHISLWIDRVRARKDKAAEHPKMALRSPSAAALEAQKPSHRHQETIAELSAPSKAVHVLLMRKKNIPHETDRNCLVENKYSELGIMRNTKDGNHSNYLVQKKLHVDVSIRAVCTFFL